MCRCNCAGKGKHGIKACDVRAGCLPKFSADSHIQSKNNNKHGQIDIHDQFSGTYLQKVPSIHGEQEMELGCEAKNPVSSREKGNSVLLHFSYKNTTTLTFLYCFENTPGEQLVQSASPVLLLKDPGGQALHNGAPVVLYSIRNNTKTPQMGRWASNIISFSC